MPSKQRSKDIQQALRAFYAQPVAKVSLELILSVVLIVVLAVAAIKPTLTTMSDLAAEIEEKEELSSALNKKIAALTTAGLQLDTLEDQLVYIDQALPEQAQIVENMKILEKVVSESKVVLQSASVSEIPDSNVALAETVAQTNQLVRQEIPISITVLGTYEDIRAFVESLQAYRRLIVIDTVSFSLEENGSESQLRASITTTFPYITSPSSGGQNE